MSFSSTLSSFFFYVALATHCFPCPPLLLSTTLSFIHTSSAISKRGPSACAASGLTLLTGPCIITLHNLPCSKSPFSIHFPSLILSMTLLATFT
ncbi:hypothetical protein GGI43DRAFT_419413 [Trichoderma evansii]